MNRTRITGLCLLVAAIALAIPSYARAQAEPFKWYGIGGELNGDRRWLGRIGITKHLGAEVVLGIDYDSEADSRYDLGAGVVYDYAPTSEITPFTVARFILNVTDTGETKTAGIVEAGGGVEYVIKERIGVSGELNFAFHLDPSRIVTSTLLRFYFYL